MLPDRTQQGFPSRGGIQGDFLFVATQSELTNADLDSAVDRIAANSRVADALKAISVATAADFSTRRLRATFLEQKDTEPETLDQPRLHYLADRSAFMPDPNMQRQFELASASPAPVSLL